MGIRGRRVEALLHGRGKGHVAVAVQVRRSLYPNSWRVEAMALVEAGQLNYLAQTVRRFCERKGQAA